MSENGRRNRVCLLLLTVGILSLNLYDTLVADML